MTTIQLPYPPSANVLWRQVGRRLIVNTKARKWKEAAALTAQAAGMRVLAGAVAVHLVLHPKLTKAGQASSVRIDVDNAIKPSLDALNGIAWIDDKQVIRIVAEVGEPIQGGGLTVTVKQHGGSE